MRKIYFDRYGEVEWLEPEDFYKGNWSIYDRLTGDDGNDYDIVLSGDKTEYRYTII